MESHKTSGNNKARKNPPRPRRNWKKTEIEKILEYLRQTILNGNDIEKPNSRAYFDAMLEKIKLQNCNTKSVTNKVSKLKSSYDAAIKWRDQSGQGVEDHQTIRDKILEICEHFDLLDEIYGTRVVNVNPYNSETTFIEPEMIDDAVDCDTIDSTLQQNPLSNDQGQGECQPDDDVIIEPNNNKSKSNTSKNSNESSKDESANVSKKRKKEPSEFAVIVNKRQAIQMEEVNIEKQKIAFDKEKLQLDREIKTQNMQLEQQKFLLQEKSALSELEFRREQLNFEREKYEQDKKFELEKFKIEQQFKYELELAKLKK